ncbi:hypothetical protein [Caballeronia telluris]|uniref:hypothetical protein n=1 Tax=Caballeronia telluris TaxID=326475 RepID=UPI00135928DD|nr:hypothetical protein [Caballeronia telluris]
MERHGSKKGDCRFRQKTTTVGCADFVPQADRIAVFDDDRTLWLEACVLQFVFALQRL